MGTIKGLIYGVRVVRAKNAHNDRRTHTCDCQLLFFLYFLPFVNLSLRFAV